MFVDEPGLQFIFSAMAGYGDLKAKEDLDLFFSMTERPRGIHLCGNPDWDFLLGLDLDILSLDIYTNFVEFCLSATLRLSIADEKRASIKSCCGKGITLALEVENIDKAWESIDKAGLNPTRIRKHAWNARVFYLFDPERHRIEIWESINAV